MSDSVSWRVTPVGYVVVVWIYSHCSPGELHPNLSRASVIQWPMTMFAGLSDDARFVLRTLRRAPGFAVGAIATIALGIGATTGVFSMLEAVALRALPYREPDRLMTIWDTHLERGLSHEPLSPVNTLDYRALAGDFDDIAAWWRPQVTLNDPATGNAVRVSTVETSENL